MNAPFGVGDEFEVPVIIEADPDDKRFGVIEFFAPTEEQSDACCVVIQFQFRTNITRDNVLHMLTHVLEVALSDPWLPDGLSDGGPDAVA